ncbi:GNAT family acetyltransferase [Tepidamorphus sp. 3E244]|uniref:GNAT family acetyltransferase n=1 Tax=Tepidamorphus sp. 3E244 TaxID=3385498 RepID=UPI0038FC2FFC
MNETELAIREMRTDETDSVAELWKACGLTRPWNDPGQDIDLAMRGQESTLLVGEADGRIAASVMVGHDGHRGTVYYVSVHPDFRGRGFGRQVMDAAEGWLMARGIWKLNLLIRTENTQVEAFYSALGYDVEPRTAMAKWLDPSKNPANAR